MLSRHHPHPRDARIRFYEETHTYTLYDEQGHPIPWKPISVTTLIHQFFSPFDPDVIIGRMMQSRRWPQSIYYGMTPEEIKAKWQQGNQLGTLLHNTAEYFYNGSVTSPAQVDPQIRKEFVFFLQFVVDFQKRNPGWRPYRTEQFVFDEEYRVAGAIDMMFINEEGQIWIVDWKRSRQIRFNNPYQSGSAPLAHLEDCNFNTYCLQLNLYRWILQRNYGQRVVKMDLLILHPDNDNYVPISVPLLEDEIDSIMEVRWHQVQQLVQESLLDLRTMAN